MSIKSAILLLVQCRPDSVLRQKQIIRFSSSVVVLKLLTQRLISLSEPFLDQRLQLNIKAIYLIT